MRAYNGLTYTDSISKANILKRQFESVFNKETSHKSFADIGVNVAQSLSSIVVSNDGVLKQLKNLDIHKTYNSQVRLFADDCIIYRPVTKSGDAEYLQADINNLMSWAEEWSMFFNPEKCEVIRVTNKKKPLNYVYKMSDHMLKSVEDKKYLGVTLQKNLNWIKQVQIVTTKANNTLSLIRRNMGGRPLPVKERCYKSLVRPILEYASTVWDPYTQANIYKLEMVQRSAARFVFQNYRRNASPSAMINELGTGKH